MGNNRGNTDDGLMMNNVIRMPCDEHVQKVVFNPDTIHVQGPGEGIN